MYDTIDTAQDTIKQQMHDLGTEWAGEKPVNQQKSMMRSSGTHYRAGTSVFRYVMVRTDALAIERGSCTFGGRVTYNGCGRCAAETSGLVRQPDLMMLGVGCDAAFRQSRS